MVNWDADESQPNDQCKCYSDIDKKLLNHKEIRSRINTDSFYSEI